MKIPKCPKRVSGKHNFQQGESCPRHKDLKLCDAIDVSRKKLEIEIDHNHIYFQQPTCVWCGMVDDREEN